MGTLACALCGQECGPMGISDLLSCIQTSHLNSPWCNFWCRIFNYSLPLSFGWCPNKDLCFQSAQGSGSGGYAHIWRFVFHVSICSFVVTIGAVATPPPTACSCSLWPRPTPSSGSTTARPHPPASWTRTTPTSPPTTPRLATTTWTQTSTLPPEEAEF